MEVQRCSVKKKRIGKTKRKMTKKKNGEINGKSQKERKQEEEKRKVM